MKSDITDESNDHHPVRSQAQSQLVNSNSSPLRRGKWTPEEEAYALAAIRDFNRGHLDAPPGATLRTYLSEKLQCDPMRITKKFTGDASIGKKVFHPAVRDDPKILKEIEITQAKLESLYQEWKQRLESQEQDMVQKSMAAAAVSVATSICENPNLHLFSNASSHLLHGVSNMRVPTVMSNTMNTNRLNIQSAKVKSDVTKTATWFDGAEDILSKKTKSSQLEKEIEEEMKVISHLIKEAPAILAISADLPNLLGNKCKVESHIRLQTSIHKLHSCPDLRDLCTTSGMDQSGQTVSTPTAGKRKRSLSDDENITDSPNNPMKLLASLSSQAAPVPIDANKDNKHSTSDSNTSNSKAIPNHHVDAEDAKTFVNFVVHVNK